MKIATLWMDALDLFAIDIIHVNVLLVNPRVSTMVCEPTSRSVTILWKSPCKVYTYSYSISYKATNNGTMRTVSSKSFLAFLTFGQKLIFN